jgi:hypothetical protein
MIKLTDLPGDLTNGDQSIFEVGISACFLPGYFPFSCRAFSFSVLSFGVTMT